MIEDDDAVRGMLTTVLEIANYEVRGVRSGEEALTVLGRWRPDVIALDLLAPNKDGFQFLDERARAADLALIPVVVVTISTAALPPASQLGVRAIMQYPHDVDYLRMVIAEAIMDAAGPPDAGELMH